MEKYKARVSVLCMLLTDDNDVLLMRRFNTGYEDGKYEFPSGHINEAESLIEAIIRECYEETGIIIKAEDLEFVGCMDNNSNCNHINILFKTKHFTGEPKIMEPDECDEIIWVKLNELDTINNLSIDTIRWLELIKEKISFKSYTG